MSNPSGDPVDDTITMVALLCFQSTLGQANYPAGLKKFLHKRVVTLIKRYAKPQPREPEQDFYGNPYR